jgi:hypothetical protein
MQILRRGGVDFIVMPASHALLRTRVEKSSTDENIRPFIAAKLVWSDGSGAPQTAHTEVLE